MIISTGLPKTKSKPYVDIVETVPISEERYLVGDALIVTFGGGDIVTHHKSEQITSTNRSKTFPSRANMCLHLSKSTDYSGSVKTSSRVNWTDHGVYFKLFDAHTFSADAHTSAVAAAKAAFGVNLGVATLGANGQAYINDAATRLRPDLTTVSVPNFLYEIDDIRKLMELWRTNIGLAKNLAGAHLNTKFGWFPTMGDLTAMVSSVVGLQAKLAAFNKTLGTIQSGRVTCMKENIAKSGSFAIDVNKKCFWRATLTKVVTGHVAWQPQPLLVLGQYEKVLAGLLDTLGFQLNPRIVWDAIPFTFVIDWFFGVGKWLETFSVDALELPIRYVDSYLQYHEEIMVESYSSMIPSLQAGNTQSPGETSGGWVTKEKFFQRMPLFPDYATLAGLGWKMPTFGQMALMVSLVTVLRKTDTLYPSRTINPVHILEEVLGVRKYLRWAL